MSHPRTHRVRAALAWTLGTFGAVFAIAWLTLGRTAPIRDPRHPRPEPGYDAAMARLDSTYARDGGDIRPECRTRLIPSGSRTDRVIVLLHGFTNCPKQFERLGEALAGRGYNVLIPRLPWHGEGNLMTTDLSRLTAEELVAAGEDAVDIAHGLGRHVTVVGLSWSAVLAAWLAQHRTDVDCAVLLA